MDRFQVRIALLKIALVALAGTTWIFCSFMFASRPDEDGSETNASNALTNLVRLPASLPSEIPGMAPQPKPEPIAMDVVKLPCWDKSDPVALDTSARWVRLIGTSCQSAPLADSVSVRNLTNGFSATVFPTQAKNMTTDFIPLQAGRNEILIRFHQADGVAVENQFSFLRE